MRLFELTRGWQEEKAAIEAVDGQRWDHLEELFADKGCKPLSSGSHGRVYANDAYPYVVKLFRKDRAYEAFLTFAAANPNKHFAKARGKVKTISIEGDYRVIRLEKLKPASTAHQYMYRDGIRAISALAVLRPLRDEAHDEDDVVSNFMRFSNYGIKDNAHLELVIAKHEKELASFNPSFVEALALIIDHFKGSDIAALDTNPANVMERPDGTPVIIDPLQPRY